MTAYTALLHQDALDKAADYLAKLQAGSRPGGFLQKQLVDHQLTGLSLPLFIELLIQTKKPQIFAETSVAGNGSDWNKTELSILGDISIAVPVTVYDNGLHRNPEIHEEAFDATLLFTPGALLRNGRGYTPADWDEVVSTDEIDEEAFCLLYERRLLPPLLYASKLAEKRNRKAFITVPGLGCGQFAGRFAGQLGYNLGYALSKIIETHQSRLPSIRAVYFDPYQECDNARQQYSDINFMVRPLTKGNINKPQLCLPTHYEEPGDDFSDCDLFSVVAWDHVSWPGNDFFAGSRTTDDGVKAAATNSMEVLTGIRGIYDTYTCEYLPPSGYKNWEDVVDRNDIRLRVAQHLRVLPER
jgi:hypothetical protein